MIDFQQLLRPIFIAVVVISTSLFIPPESAEAADDWRLLSGTSSENELGTYPLTLGQPGYPRARAYPATWVDLRGGLWMFGGTTRGISGSGTSFMNNLWKYSPDTGAWTWENGSDWQNAPPTFPAETQQQGIPGGRSGAVDWIDSEGDLWMFGGRGNASDGNGYLNDLWRYDIDAEVWIWEAGSTLKNDSGTTTRIGGVGYPKARTAAEGFTGTDEYFYLFGGALPGNPSLRVNDLWRFNPAYPGEWTLLSGNGVPNTHAIYPDQVGEAGYPGSRSASSGWTDHNGDLWLFGGYGFGSQTYEQNLNDMWKYDRKDETWLWYGGASNPGDYPATHNSTGIPANRNRATAFTANGDLWLFGGYGNVSGFGRLHDLWKFDVAERHWILMDGSNETNDPGIYPANFGEEGRPSGRTDAAGWTSFNGETLYLFGGQTPSGEYLSDFWSHPTSPQSDVSKWQSF